MNLHQHLTRTLDELAGPGPDLVDLAATARTRGSRLKRRRTAGLVAAAGVIAAGLVGGLALITPGGGDSSLVASDPGSATTTVVQPDLTGPTKPTTAPGAVLGLQWAVLEQRGGTASELAGQLGGESGDHYVELRWDDADGLGASVVGLNVQYYGGMGLRCPEAVRNCTRSTSPDGSRVISFEDRTVVPDGTAVRRTVDLRRADGTRVVISATNGSERGGGRWDLTRVDPPLSASDLEAIVRQSFWGPTLPEAWVDAGAGLQGYVDFDADRGDWLRGSSAPPPTSGPTSSPR